MPPIDELYDQIHRLKAELAEARIAAERADARARQYHDAHARMSDALDKVMRDTRGRADACRALADDMTDVDPAWADIYSAEARMVTAVLKDMRAAFEAGRLQEVPRDE
jgi:hypothetical protein